MKFLLIGHFCFDVFHPADGSEQERPGGIYHAAAMLSALAARNDVVLPVCGLAKEDFTRVSSLFGALPGVSPDALFRIDTPTNKVHMLPDREGVVCSSDIAPPIPFEKLRRHLGSDAILVNMESGFDIALETLDQIRMGARDDGTPIHFDYHNLTLGVNERHERYRRPLEAWRRWSFMIDTVQLNEEEIGGLDAVPGGEEKTVGHLLTLGVKGVLLTRGSRGVTVYCDEHKHVIRTDIPASPLAQGTGTTGAGDMFGAAFLCQYRKTRNIAAAAGEAATAVAVRLGQQ